MKFLSETNYRTEIERVLSNNEPTDVAVAFWGKDSLSLFDPNAKKKIRIICNLESAGCNPTAIRGLIKHTNICVKSNKHLHAKILLQKTSIIIGSANISANGLSLEGSELNGWIEAGIVVKDQSAIKDSAKWYNQLWKSSSIITNEMLVTAEKLWLTRRNQRPMKKTKKSLFEAAMENISNFEDRKIVFAIYRDKLSNEATAVLKHEKIAHKTMSTKIGCYENWSDIAHRTDIIDIYYGPKGGVKLNGIYQTLGRNGIKKFKYNDGETGAITLCLKANSIEGFIITKEFESAIKRNIAELWEFNRNDVSGNIIPLSDGLRILQENL